MIIYKNKSYKTRTLDIPDYGYDLVIGTESLQNKLMTYEGAFVSDEAESIDTEIFFFVPDDMIDDPEDKLILFITEQL